MTDDNIQNASPDAQPSASLPDRSSQEESGRHASELHGDPDHQPADLTLRDTVSRTAHRSGSSETEINPGSPIAFHQERPGTQLVGFTRAHWAERPAIRIAVNVLMSILVLILVFLVWQRAGAGRLQNKPMGAPGSADSLNPPVSDGSLATLAPLATPSHLGEGIFRIVDLRTIIPSRPRVEVITYTVQKGDNLFGIADNFNLKPETILWGNFEILKDNPHLLSPDQVLRIMPTNGTYYQWKAGDTLGGIAAFFGVTPQAILDYPGNHLDLTQKEAANYGIQPGTWLIVPGGKRAIKDWGPPAISRNNPAVARYYGQGSCGSVVQGAVGTGTFVWPTTEHFISGYHFDPGVHPAIDIGGHLGNPVYATDAGVVVYAGWSNYGYGNLIVIDHGNGWQSAYAHLSAINVNCGQSVFQGGYIGALGSTGNSSGPHLHFELSLNGAKVNGLDYLH